MSFDPDWLKKQFPNAKYSFDLESLIGREVTFTKRGVRMRFDELGHPIVDRPGYSITKEKFVFTKEQIAQNKFYIGSNTIFQKSGGWGHPTVDDAVRHAQQMLQMDDSKGELFIVEIVRVVKRKPIDVDVETV